MTKITLDPDRTDIQIGQRLMIGFNGTVCTDELRRQIEAYKLGGVILFARNITDPEQLTSLCQEIQDVARAIQIPPLFIAIDQEGGEVARLKAPFTVFPGNPSMTGEKDAAAFARITARELSQVGVNMNMAPVMDINFKTIPSIMAGRSFGDDPQWVTRLGVQVIEGLQRRRVIAVAKHFPGIGRTTTDSHLVKPVLDTAIDRLAAVDLIPFRAAVAHQVGAVMLSHIVYTGIDPVWPASLSPQIVKTILRRQMGYEGVVMTDDLDMRAIKDHFDLHTVIQQILTADIDIVLICHQGPDIAQAFDSMTDLIHTSTAHANHARRSFERIMRLKRRYLTHPG